ncbi:MAG: hypothetical protein LBN39_11640 [Planctomycetaceae bacterium]|jgi:hypothetical protein|nr:hypothetical protein [Planctomycetaceae bacterium]
MKNGELLKSRRTILTAGILFLGGGSVLAQRETVPGDPKEQEKPVVVNVEKNVKKKRLREGTVFQGSKVTFRATGNRTTMFPVDNAEERFVVLENLNLERILRTIEDKPQRSVWKIDGIYTEFRGENYILIQRAVSVAD